jgi:hypothetical protein
MSSPRINGRVKAAMQKAARPTVREGRTTVIGETLHRFQLLLCYYVRNNVCEDFHDPDFVAFLKRQLTPALFDHLWRYFHDTPSVPRQLLNDEELDELEQALLCRLRQAQMPSSMRPRSPRPQVPSRWEPQRELHRQHIDCVREIRQRLGKRYAREWTETNARLDRQLAPMTATLWPHEGIQIVREWLQELQRYLKAMGGDDLLPRPEGAFPTPTTQSLPPTPSQPSSPTTPLKDALSEAEDRMSKVIADHKKGKIAPPMALIKKARIREAVGRQALRRLEAQGEYNGFNGPQPRRYRKGPAAGE